MLDWGILLDQMLKYGLKIAIGIVIVIAGKIISNKFRKVFKLAMKRSKMDEMLMNFLGDMIYYAIFIISIVLALNTVGFKTTSIAAVIGAATLAIGLSLQSNLSNIGSGIMILMTKPFSVSDTVEIGGILGIVEKVSIFNTKLKTFDNKLVFVPNSKIASSEIINYSAEKIRRLDLLIGIDYKADIKLAKEILEKLANEDERVLKEPAYFIGVFELGDSSINITYRIWVNVVDFLNVRCDMLEKIKLEFDKNNIAIPFPQMDITIRENKAWNVKS